MFHKRIKELRLENNLSKVDMAKKLGVAESTVRSWESNKSEPRWKVLRKISETFNVEEDWLIGFGEEVTEDSEVDLNYYGTVSAGNFEDVSTGDGTIKVPKSIFKGINANECFALQVNGDSMNKVLSNGSYIVIHDYRKADAPALNNSDILLIRNGGSHTIKRARLTDTKVHFEPDSYIDEFKVDTYDIDFSEDIEVIGRVIYNYRKF